MVDLEGKLRLHEAFKYEVIVKGAEREPVLMIDNFLADAKVLVDHAAEDCAFSGVADAFYPGIRAPIAPIYAFALRAFLGPIIEQVFGLKASDTLRERSDFSLVTKPSGALQPLQRIPHIDNTNPKQLALLHYLCRPDQGGTSFYRHRSTGFEIVTEDRFARYRETLTRELAEKAPAPAYVCGDTPLFERIRSCGAVFNRVLVYRSLNIHGADIAPEFVFDPNPRTGRLTANTFFFY